LCASLDFCARFSTSENCDFCVVGFLLSCIVSAH
jgi:hypothetical protein